MTRTWTIIAVADVRKSVAWYIALLDARNNHPGATVFDQIIDKDETVLLSLHCWGPSGPHGDHNWPTLANPSAGEPGNGILLWFVVDDFEATWERAQLLDAPIEEPPNTNNGTGMRAFVVRDPDGYHVVINERRK